MKPKIFSLSFIILLIVCAGCKKINWIEVGLSNLNCGNHLLTVATYNQVRDKVTSIPGIAEEPAFIFIESSDVMLSKDYVYPCNLPLEFRTEGLQIVFDGELKEIKNGIDTNESNEEKL